MYEASSTELGRDPSTQSPVTVISLILDPSPLVQICLVLPPQRYGSYHVF